MQYEYVQYEQSSKKVFKEHRAGNVDNLTMYVSTYIYIHTYIGNVYIYMYIFDMYIFFACLCDKQHRSYELRASWNCRISLKIGLKHKCVGDYWGAGKHRQFVWASLGRPHRHQ